MCKWFGEFVDPGPFSTLVPPQEFNISSLEVSIALAWAFSLVTSLLRALFQMVLEFICFPSMLAPVKSMSMNFQMSL